jgi:hypothetical protein
MSPVVAVVANPKRSGGARRRLESIVALSEQLGCRVEVFQPTLSPSPRGMAAAVTDLIRGQAVPEVLAWNPEPVVRGLVRLAPDIVVYQTTRALHPAVTGAMRGAGRSKVGTPVQIIDLVDRLSISYRQRARAGAAALNPAFRVLATAHERAELRLLASAPSETGLPIVAAGYREATDLGIHWIPNMPPPTAPNPQGPGPIPDDGRRGPGNRHDAVFFGTLDYRPNIEALQTLHRWVAEDAGQPPSVLVAGRNPSAEVRELCRINGWTLELDFASVPELARRAAVAIAPLQSTSGIQNKIMEAAQAGLPQVVTSAAAAGYHPAIPLPIVDTGPAFLAELRHLVNHPAAVQTQVAAVRRHLTETISFEAVAPRWGRLLEPGPDRRERAPTGPWRG